MMNGDVKKEELELKEEKSETVEAKQEIAEKNDTSDLKETVEHTEAKEPIVTEVIKSPKVEGEDEDSEEDALAPNENVEVKPPPQVDVKQLHSNPDFASICSFFNKFGAMIGFKPMSFPKLESMLTTFDDQGRIGKELIDLHLALMRRLRMSSIRFETWETYLKKFLEISEGTSTELLQLERYGYVHLPVSTKILILKYLCDAQFDFNPRLKENMVAACKAVDLRLIPVGMDKNGFSYWFQQDVEYNIRVYTEEPDDLSGVTWTLVVNSPEDLINLIARLKKEDLGYVKKEPTKKEKEKEEARKAQEEDGLIQMTTKKGTFLDTCYDDASVKKMRENLIKQKEEKKQRREKKQQESENEEEEEEEEEKQPEEQEEELDRRMMPRRSAASRAVTNIKKFATTPQRRSSGPRKKKEVEEADDEEKKSASGSESGSEEDEEDDEFQSEEDNNDEDEDDDEFRPKSEKKKKGKKRRRKKKVELDDDDDDDDSDEDEEPKERKLATGDSACGQCKKSSDWDVLLLCDVCDDAWHTYCLKPMLWFVPDGDWFCPKCVHGMLIERLEEVEKCLDGHLKKKMAEDRRKKAAADRLRREMEYIGVSLNNIIPTTMKQAQPSSSSSSDEDDGQRRSKRKAVKRIAPRSKFQMEVIQTIAEGRSRRRTKHVDYNFSEYDSMIHEACAELGDSAQKEAEPGPAGVVRPTGGAGRGKDMANILEAEKIRKGSVEGDEDDEVERQLGKPARSQAKPKRKLNDLDIDNREESDSEEYQANESDEEVADEEEALSGSDYVPSDEQRRTRRSGTRAAGFREYGPTQSDEDFVVSGSDESDFGYRGKKRKIEKRKIKKKKGRWNGSDSEESENYSDDSDYGPQKKKMEKQKKPKYSSSEENEDEEELEIPSEDDEDVPRTETGRPMRKAVVKAKVTKDSDDELDEDEEEEEEEEEEPKKKEERPVGALDRSERNPPENSDDDSEEDFKPEEDAEEEEDEEEDEEEEVVAKETPKMKTTVEEKDDSNQAKKRKPLDEDVSEPSLKRVKENVPEVKKNEPVEAKPIPPVPSSLPSHPAQTTSPKSVKNVAPVPVTPAASSRNEVELEPPHAIAKPKVMPPKPIPQGPPNYGVPGPYMNHYYQGPPTNMPPYGLPPAPYNPYAPPAAHWQQPPPNLYGPPPATGLPHNPYAPVPVPNPYSQSTSQAPPGGSNLNDLQSL